GLIFVYLVLGLMCTTVNEWIAQMSNLRARTLESGIRGLLANQPGLLTSFFNHPLIKSLGKGDKKPSYTPSQAFVIALIDSLPNTGPADALAAVESSVNQLPDGQVKQSLLTLLKRSNNDLVVFERYLTDWFDHSMDRVSGWYKQKTQVITAIVAASIAIFA